MAGRPAAVGGRVCFTSGPRASTGRGFHRGHRGTTELRGVRSGTWVSSRAEGRCPKPPRGSGASCRVSRSRPQTGSSPGGLQRAGERVLVPAAGGTLLGCCVPPQVWIFWRNKPVFRVSCPFPSSPRETPNACGRVRRPPLLGGQQPVSPWSPAHGRPCPREDRGRERGSRQRFLPRESLWFRAETPARCPLGSLSKTKSVKMRTFQQFIKIPRRGSNRRNYPRCIQSVIS